MRVLIYGGREFVPSNKSFAFFHDLWIFQNLVGKPITKVISGHARGADEYGERLANFWNIPLELYPADWETHGKAAGFIRNQEMLDSGVDLAVQFPGGNGTKDMRKRLDKAGVRVVEYHEE